MKFRRALFEQRLHALFVILGLKRSRLQIRLGARCGPGVKTDVLINRALRPPVRQGRTPCDFLREFHRLFDEIFGRRFELIATDLDRKHVAVRRDHHRGGIAGTERDFYLLDPRLKFLKDEGMFRWRRAKPVFLLESLEDEFRETVVEILATEMLLTVGRNYLDMIS